MSIWVMLSNALLQFARMARLLTAAVLHEKLEMVAGHWHEDGEQFCSTKSAHQVAEYKSILVSADVASVWQ